MKKVLIISFLIGLFGCSTKPIIHKYESYQDSIDEQKYVDSALAELTTKTENNVLTNSSSVEEVLNKGSKCSIMSQDFVKSKLKYPEEVNFEQMGYVHEREGVYAIILNKFTAKNGFGVEISYVYKIWLKFNGGDWSDINNWEYKKLIIEGSDGSKEIF